MIAQPEEYRHRGGQLGRPKGAYCRGGGCHALWVEVLKLALIDWMRTEGSCRRVSKTGKVYTYRRGSNGGRLHGAWFDGPWCREIVIMIEESGLKSLRFYFTEKSHLTADKRERILVKIDYLEKYLK